MSKIDFQSLRLAPEVETFNDPNRVVIITDDGVRQTSRTALLGRLGGADIIEWNPRVSRVASGVSPRAFRRFFMIPGDPQATHSVPAVDADANTVTKAPVSLGGLERSAWVVNGSIPETGNHWLAINADCSDPLTTHKVFVGRQVVEELIGSELDDVYGIIEFTDSTIRVTRRDTGLVQQATVSSPLQKVLLQITPTEIQVYITGGSIFTFGVRGTEDLLMGGVIVSTAEVEQYLQLNNTDINSAPRTPDTGFVALEMLDSVLPVDAYPTDVLFTRSPSVFRDQMLRESGYYLLAADEVVIPLVDEEHVATLDGYNRFTQGVGFSATYAMSAKSDNNYFVGPYDSALLTAVSNDRAAHTTSVGRSFTGIGSGSYNHLYAYGHAFNTMTDPMNNVGIGDVGNLLTSPSDENVMAGALVAPSLTSVNRTVFVGHNSGDLTGFNVDRTVAIGYHALSDQVDGNNLAQWGNVAVGAHALQYGVVDIKNVAVGGQALQAGSDSVANSAVNNTAVGFNALSGRVGAVSNSIAIGAEALQNTESSLNDIAIGQLSAQGLHGNNTIAIGTSALASAQGPMTDCVAIGRNAMAGLGATSNSTAVGSEATVTASNQVQLGNSATTTFVYGSVQSRSDERDKTGVRDTGLGLNFILSLRPVDYQWDYREDYVSYASMPVEPAPLPPEPAMDGTVSQDDPRYDSVYNTYLLARSEWNKLREQRTVALERYSEELADWQNQINLTNVTKDGSKRRTRYHHGFLAQEVRQAAQDNGADFGGYQDHAINGGKDVKSLGYEEFIAPTVRAIQELHGKLSSEELVEQVTERVLSRIANEPDNPLFDLIAERLLTKLTAARRA